MQRSRAAIGLAGLAAVGLGCKGAATAFVAPPLGPDTTAPVVELSPAHDTTVDSTGTLLLAVTAHDRVWVTDMELVIVGGSFAFPPIAPDTTAVAESFPIALAGFKHSTFRWYVVATDLLHHQRVTDTVTVSVR